MIYLLIGLLDIKQLKKWQIMLVNQKWMNINLYMLIVVVLEKKLYLIDKEENKEKVMVLLVELVIILNLNIILNN